MRRHETVQHLPRPSPALRACQILIAPHLLLTQKTPWIGLVFLCAAPPGALDGLSVAERRYAEGCRSRLPNGTVAAVRRVPFACAEPQDVGMYPGTFIAHLRSFGISAPRAGPSALSDVRRAFLLFDVEIGLRDGRAVLRGLPLPGRPHQGSFGHCGLRLDASGWAGSRNSILEEERGRAFRGSRSAAYLPGSRRERPGDF